MKWADTSLKGVVPKTLFASVFFRTRTRTFCLRRASLKRVICSTESLLKDMTANALAESTPACKSVTNCSFCVRFKENSSPKTVQRERIFKYLFFQTVNPIVTNFVPRIRLIADPKLHSGPSSAPEPLCGRTRLLKWRVWLSEYFRTKSADFP